MPEDKTQKEKAEELLKHWHFTENLLREWINELLVELNNLQKENKEFKISEGIYDLRIKQLNEAISVRTQRIEYLEKKVSVLGTELKASNLLIKIKGL